MVKTQSYDNKRSVSLSSKSVFLASFLFLFLLLNSTFVLSAPPVTTVQQFPEGFIIIEQQIHTFQYGQPLRYGFLLENATDGKTIDNSTIDYCRLLTSNSQGFNTQVTEIIYQEEYHLWGIELNESEVLRHFPSIGNYNYLISCQDSKGGVLTGIFEITESGVESDTINTSFSQQSLILLFSFLIGLITFILYLYNKDEYYLTIISGILFLFSGVYSFYVLPLILESLISNIIGIIMIAFGLLSLSESIWRYFPD